VSYKDFRKPTKKNILEEEIKRREAEKKGFYQQFKDKYSKKDEVESDEEIDQYRKFRSYQSPARSTGKKKRGSFKKSFRQNDEESPYKLMYSPKRK